VIRFEPTHGASNSSGGRIEPGGRLLHPQAMDLSRGGPHDDHDREIGVCSFDERFELRAVAIGAVPSPTFLARRHRARRAPFVVLVVSVLSAPARWLPIGTPGPRHDGHDGRGRLRRKSQGPEPKAQSSHVITGCGLSLTLRRFLEGLSSLRRSTIAHCSATMSWASAGDRSSRSPGSRPWRSIPFHLHGGRSGPLGSRIRSYQHH